MSALALHPEFPQPSRKASQLALIVLGHVLLFYCIYAGMLHRVVQRALPMEVTVQVMPLKVAAPPPAPVPPMPATSAPAVVSPPPVIAVQSLENAITTQVQAAPPAVAEFKAQGAPAAAPPAPPAPSGPRLLSSGVEYVQAPQVVYPAMSKRLGERGKVVLRVLVNEKGIAEQAIVHSSSGFNRLDEAGRQAALHALFKPYMENGKAQSVFALVTLSFELAS